jgi:hypothetical protein
MKQCDKCGESVDEAKAFCPACGHAFVEEEKRTDQSKFDQLDHTMQMGQTMYNKMLSDMGLNIADTQKEPVENVKPAPQVIQPAVRQQVLQPAVSQTTKPSVEKTNADAEVPVTPRIDKRTKWVIIAAVAALLLFVLVIAIALAGFAIWRWSFR